jgi:hypothetical protein
MGISYSGFGESTSKLSGLAVSPPGALTAKYNNAPTWITPSGSLGAANGGVAYTFNFQAIDEENDTITYNVVSGSLPSGISLSGNQLIGTPVNNPGNYTFTISISDGNFSVNRTFNLDITNQTPIWNTAAGTLGTLNLNVYGTYSLSATDPNGDTITYSIISGSLPSGMTLSGNVISGTPSTTGTSNFTITASDGKGGNVDRAFSIIVSVASFANRTFTGSVLQNDTCINVAHDGTNLYKVYFSGGAVYKNDTLFFNSNVNAYGLAYTSDVMYVSRMTTIYKFSSITGAALGNIVCGTDINGLVVANNKIYSMEYSGQVRILNLSGSLLSTITDSRFGGNNFKGIAIDPAGNLYVMTNDKPSQIFVYSSSNGVNYSYLKTITLSFPATGLSGMCFNQINGDLYIAAYNSKIYKYTSQ